MRTDTIVVFPPCSNHDVGLWQAEYDLALQALVLELLLGISTSLQV
jgi:hypothetical protein